MKFASSNSKWGTWHDIFSKLEKSSLEKPQIEITIPITENNFGDLLKKTYSSEIEQLCSKGEMLATLYLLKSGVIYLMYCIEEGDCGDCDGFGVESDIWIFSYIDINGNIIVPFELSESELLKKADQMYGTIWTEFGMKEKW